MSQGDHRKPQFVQAPNITPTPVNAFTQNQANIQVHECLESSELGSPFDGQIDRSGTWRVFNFVRMVEQKEGLLWKATFVLKVCEAGDVF